MARKKEKDITELSATELEKLVNEHGKNLEKIADFARDVITKCGKQIHHRNIGSDRSEYKWELSDFHKFDMYMDHGFVSIYGNSLIIYYNPRDRDGCISSSEYPPKPVFEAQYIGSFEADDEETTVKTYVKGIWEKKIKQLMKNKHAVIKKHMAKLEAEKQEKKKEKKEYETEQKEDFQKRKAFDKAKRLKLI